MPILDIQRRLTQLGVIRLGRQVPTGKTSQRTGKPTFRPEKLDRFRLTSPDQTLIAAVAGLYGGTPAQWQGPSGPEWEVVTGAKALPVLVPPQKIDPNYELWGNGFRERLCDGATERQRGCDCLCLRGSNGHVHEFQFGGLCECGESRACKPTTRLSLMLAEIPGLGVWKLESHGRNAAAELPMTSDALENSPRPVPATLVIQAVEKKVMLNAGKPNEEVKPRSFFVPRLVFDFVTPQQAFSGQIAAVAQAALSGAARPAIGSAPAESPTDKLIALVKLAKNREQLSALWVDAREQVPDGDPDLDRLKAAFSAAGERFKPPPAAQQEKSAPVSQAPVDQVVDAELVEDGPDADTVWMQILGEAGKRQWSTADVEQQFRGFLGLEPNAASGGQMQTFLTAMKNGQVA